VFVTPGRQVCGQRSIENKAATVIDLETEKPSWEVKFDVLFEPMAFETAAMERRRRIFVQLSGFNGFAGSIFAKRAEVARISCRMNGWVWTR